LAVPLVCFALVRPIAPDWALGVLIVMAMPAGMTSSAMADLYRADVPFVLALTLLTSVLCPVSIPLLTSWFDSTRAHIEPSVLAGRAAYIVVLLTVPFALAQLTRRVAKRVVLRYHDRWGYGSMASTCLLIFVAISANRGAWAALDGTTLAIPLALTGALMTGIAALGAFGRRHASAGRVDGLTYGCLWMNNGLAVAFCDRFFHGNPRAMLPAIVIQLPIVASVAAYGTLALRRASTPIPGQQKTR
jgi:predicted Na+-dependent transporter